MQRLKIGIIVDDMTVPKYYLDFINQISEEHSFFDEPVIINPTHYYDMGKYFLALDYARDELV